MGYSKLKKALGIKGGHTRIFDVVQQLAQVEDEVIDALGLDIIDIGRVFGKHPGPQILVDIDHQPLGKSPMWILDETGERLARITTDYSRHHALLDWTGDGLDEIIVACNGAVYDNGGRRIATLTAPGDEAIIAGSDKDVEHRSLLIGDMDGDGVRDVIMTTNTTVCIYRNEHGKRFGGSVPLGTGPNVTLY